MMKHRGEIVEKAVRQNGYPLTKLAIRLGKSRRWIYNAFENAQLSIDYILAIGKIIHYDFSEEIDELKGTSSTIEESSFQPYTAQSKDVDYWKMKYYELLEKYNTLLEDRLGK
jgi:predicted transcriptional regulator